MNDYIHVPEFYMGLQATSQNIIALIWYVPYVSLSPLFGSNDCSLKVVKWLK